MIGPGDWGTSFSTNRLISWIVRCFSSCTSSGIQVILIFPMRMVWLPHLPVWYPYSDNNLNVKLIFNKIDHLHKMTEYRKHCTHMYVHIWPNTPQLTTVQCLPLLLTKSLSLRALSNIFDSGDALATLLLDLFQSLRRRREEINARSWPTATSIRPTPRAPGVRGRRGRGWALSFGQLYRCLPTPRTTPCLSR